jgi:hypothetical protein
MFYLKIDNKIKSFCQKMYISDFLSHHYEPNK